MTAAEAHAAAAAEGCRCAPENVTSFKGVTRQTDSTSKPFKAGLKHDGRQKHLGSFATAEEAALAVARFLTPEMKEEAEAQRQDDVDREAVADAKRAAEAERVQIKEERAAEAARALTVAADGIEMGSESINLTDELPPPALFTPTDEDKPCPKCERMVTISRKRQRSRCIVVTATAAPAAPSSAGR